LVEAARNHLSESHLQLTRAIRGTLTSRRQAETARAEAEAAKIAADQERKAAEEQRHAFEERQAAFDRWVKAVAALKPGDRVRVKRFDREGRVVRVLLHKQLAVVNVGAMEAEVPLREVESSLEL
jgi:dsDNA-specific endonuclease/ATPase MutS2